MIHFGAAGRDEFTTSDPDIDPAPPGKDRDRKRKRRTLTAAQPSVCRWRTNYQQRIYSSKLIEALRRVRRTETPLAPVVHPRGRSIRNAADRVLAIAAHGRTRWSRAILAYRSIGQKLQRVRAATAASGSIGQKKSGASDQAGERPVKQPSLERKANLLARLVPGCRKLSLPSLLDEVSDYIAALEMQVRAMSTLVDILSGSSGAAGDEALAAGQLLSTPPS